MKSKLLSIAPHLQDIRRRYKMCSRKKAYDSEANAKNSRQVRELNLYVYKCPHGNHWHATKVKQ